MAKVETLTIRTERREQLIDISERVQRVVVQSGARDGMVYVYSPHTTAAVTIQENADPDVQRDLLTHLGALVPHDGDFRHAEGNSDAHIKAALLGASQAAPVLDGRVLLGTWQSFFFCELDGPRERRLVVKIIEG